MVMTDWKSVAGVLARGYRVASGPSQDYPFGALDRQRPIFKSRGLNLDGYFNGTLNIDISPHAFRVFRPELTFHQVEWTDLHPPEDFSFSRCLIFFRECEYPGWVYYPHPETKLRHFQNPSLIEAVAHPIPGINYGDELFIRLNPAEIELY